MSQRPESVPVADRTTPPEPETGPRPLGLDLSLVQVVGGALAAMTAAALGSRFGVEGTLVGAALASVIAAVASALYTASLRRTSAAVRGVLGGRRTRSAATGETAGTAATAASPTPAPTGSAAAPVTPARTRRRWTLVVSSVVGAMAIFGLAGGALTAYEAIAGQALSGGDGTTIQQVQRGGSPDRPSEEPSSEPSESADATESPEPTPTDEPAETPESDPAPTTEPSPAPPEEPTAEPSATADEPEPETTTEQPDPAPSQEAETPR